MRRAHISTFACLLACSTIGLSSCGEDEDPKPGESLPPEVPEQVCPSVGGAGGAGGAGGSSGALQLTFDSIGLGDADGVTDFRFLPGEEGTFLLSARRGRIYLGKLSGNAVSLKDHWDIPEDVVSENACGLTNLLLDPEFDESGFIYVSYCATDTVTRLVRYTWSRTEGLSDKQVIFETDIEEATETWHRFGSMGFEEDGETLWMLVGDHFDSDKGQTLDDPLGSLVRIVPSRKEGEGGHEIPAGNMAEVVAQGGAAATDIDPTVFAYGFRSPWRGTRDSLGRVWVGDVGLGKSEEVDLVTEAGQNFGWDEEEGPCTGNCEDVVDPVAYFGRTGDDAYLLDDPEAVPATKRAIWLGDIYENPPVDRYCGLMNDVVIYGDLFAGFVRGIRADADGDVTYNEQLGHLENVTAWRTGTDGYAYALTLDGSLNRVRLDLPE